MPGAFPFIRTMQQLERHLTRIRGLENHRRIYGEAARLAGRPFPAPPLPGNGNIEPLTSVDALIDEGIEQKNCAGDYGRRVIFGALYLYRVMLPDRATLSIQAVSGRWRIDQLRSKCNGPVKDRTRQIVERWLHENQR
jgi:hypothetical protein